MSFMDEMKNVFSKKTPEQIYVESVLKEIRQRDDLIKTVSQMSSQLDHCQRAFDNAIRISRINALRRRQAHLSDAGEKERIRDAVVGQLAVQEAKFDVNSIVTAQDMEIAMKKLGGILRQMYRMDHNVSVTKKDLKEARNLQFDNTVEPIAFSERAALVDERFVERIIQGESIADCLQAVPVGSTGPLESDMGPINFESPAGGATAEDLKILQDQTGQDW